MFLQKKPRVSCWWNPIGIRCWLFVTVFDKRILREFLLESLITFPYNLLLNCRFLLVRRAKYALGAIRKKISNDNPHVTMYALQVGTLPLESILNVDSAESFWFGSAGAWMCCQELWFGHSCWDRDSRVHGLHEGYGTCKKCSLLTTATYLWLTSIAVFAEASGSGARESLWVGAGLVARLSLWT